MSATAALALTHSLQLWHLVLAGFLSGAGAAFFYPAYSALLPRMLPAAELLAANGIEGTVRPVVQTALVHWRPGCWWPRFPRPRDCRDFGNPRGGPADPAPHFPCPGL
ncbi:hypothetical protein [Arthrobacter sp. JCM 19049]|uniref:hypothetical protein n=1 Tax=Arthrobacter sp. JCM 19049 TaxID=1460643 RepID=UPI0006D19C29|nr:hypothetical protein [Arthrobacter sp. JCM 19049]